jgi:hypothetical protein
MSDAAIAEYIQRLGATRKELRASLVEIDDEIRLHMRQARAVMTQEAIRDATGVSVPTIRAWSTAR